MTTLRDTRGIGFVTVLLTLLILAVLYFGYFRVQGTSERGTHIQSLEASKAVACRVQRQQIERDIQMYTASHDGPPQSLADLESAGIHIPSCPEGGQYSLVGTHVVCSVHH